MALLAGNTANRHAAGSVAQQRHQQPVPFLPFRGEQHCRPASCRQAAAGAISAAAAQLPVSSRRVARRAQRVLAQASKNEEVQVKSEQLSTCARKLTVTVPGAMVQQCFHTTVDKLTKLTGRLPGFRDGKIPLSMVITQCGGQQKFKLTVIEEILLTAMPLVMERLAEPVVPNSERIASDIRELEKVFDPAKPLTFNIEYETVPPVTWRRSYRDIEVTIRDTGDFASDTAAADDLIRQYLKDRGVRRVVVGRGLQAGDTAVLDMKMVEVGGKMPLPGLSSDRFAFDTDVDPLGLTQHLLGAKVGEERKFQVTFPPDYNVELWQNMRADVSVKVKELFWAELPQFDDEFVKAHFPKFESAEEMKRSLVATTAMERLKALDQELADAVMQAVCDVVELQDIPETLVLDMGATQYRAALLQMIEDRVAPREEVERLASEEMVEEYCVKHRRELEDLVKYNIAVEEIAATEGLAVEEADVAAEVDLRKQQYEAQGVEYDEQAVRDQVLDTLKHIRVTEWLKDNVKRTTLPWDGQKPAAAKAGAA